MDPLSPIVLIAVAAVVVIVVWLMLRLSAKARQVDLTDTPEGQQPAWRRTTPPPETRTATGGESNAFYGEETGEQIAAPFAEQIEDIVRTRLRRDPLTANHEVDLGTSEDGGLEIWVDGERYTDIDALPDPRLQQVFRDAIARWEETQSSSS